MAVYVPVHGDARPRGASAGGSAVLCFVDDWLVKRDGPRRALFFFDCTRGDTTAQNAEHPARGDADLSSTPARKCEGRNGKKN